MQWLFKNVQWWIEYCAVLNSFTVQLEKFEFLRFQKKTNERSLPFPMKVCLTPPSTVAGNFTHFIKLKSPLYSFFQQNFGNNISTIQTSLRRKMRLLSNQSFKEKWTWNKYTKIGSKRKITFYETVGCKNCLLIRRNKYIHSVQSRAHTCETFPREYAPEPP